MGDLSRNFNRYEFLCHHCSRVVGPTPALVTVLQRLRTTVGSPLRIVSGYRCPDHNRAVGGFVRSQHLLGNAADIPGGYATVQQCQRAGAAGIGVRGLLVVHVDMTPGWKGHVFKDE
jgi:uncharacterized protein YcbK (DUF882 family)